MAGPGASRSTESSFGIDGHGGSHFATARKITTNTTAATKKNTNATSAERSAIAAAFPRNDQFRLYSWYAIAKAHAPARVPNTAPNTAPSARSTNDSLHSGSGLSVRFWSSSGPVELFGRAARRLRRTLCPQGIECVSRSSDHRLSRFHQDATAAQSYSLQTWRRRSTPAATT